MKSPITRIIFLAECHHVGSSSKNDLSHGSKPGLNGFGAKTLAEYEQAGVTGARLNPAKVGGRVKYNVYNRHEELECVNWRCKM